MNTETELDGLARTYYQALPGRIQKYLRNRGIADPVIDRHLLGWNGSRITIPISNQAGEIVFFKLAKDPEDQSKSPKMLTPVGAKAELYGWECLIGHPEQIIICEGEFDRLVLESQGLAALTSTGGAGCFRAEWAEAFRGIPQSFVCFDRDPAGERGAERVARLIPQARLVHLPEEVGAGGDVTDFFVRLGRSREEFLKLLDAAVPLPESPLPREPESHGAPAHFVGRDEIDQIKSLISLEELIGQYITLRRSGETFVARCPFHDDRDPSFVVYARTQSFHCFGCQEHGDAFSFLMRLEHLTFTQALKALRKLSP